MENYVIATNSDNRVEAFYIENGIVMHTWELNNKLLWSAPNPLTNGNGQPLRNAIRVEATTDMQGQIQVVAYCNDNNFYICFQTPGAWNGWDKITQN